MDSSLEQISAAKEQNSQWYALRVTYGRQLKVIEKMKAAGIKTFVPMRMKYSQPEKKFEYVPVINNILFAFAPKIEIQTFIAEEGESRMTHFIWDRSTREPIMVPEKQMDDFIRIYEIAGDEAVYLEEVSSKLKAGKRVRVVSGPFEGIEGIVVRVQRSRRILVALSGILSIATPFVPIENIEIIP